MRLLTATLASSILLATAGGCSMTSSWFSSNSTDGIPSSPAKSFDQQLSLARLSERHGKPQDAMRLYEGVLGEAPSHTLANHRLGVVLARMGEYDRALDHLERARESARPTDDLLADLGYCHYLNGNLEEAEAHLRSALRINPQSRKVRNNMGIVLGEQRRFNEALEQFAMAGTQAEAYANLAFIESQVGVLDEAEKHYHMALNLDKNLRPAAEALVQISASNQGRRSASPNIEADPAMVANAKQATQGQKPSVKQVSSQSLKSLKALPDKQRVLDALKAAPTASPRSKFKKSEESQSLATAKREVSKPESKPQVTRGNVTSSRANELRTRYSMPKVVRGPSGKSSTHSATRAARKSAASGLTSEANHRSVSSSPSAKQTELAHRAISASDRDAKLPKSSVTLANYTDDQDSADKSTNKPAKEAAKQLGTPDAARHSSVAMPSQRAYAERVQRDWSHQSFARRFDAPPSKEVQAARNAAASVFKIDPKTPAVTPNTAEIAKVEVGSSNQSPKGKVVTNKFMPPRFVPKAPNTSKPSHVSSNPLRSTDGATAGLRLTDGNRLR